MKRNAICFSSVLLSLILALSLTVPAFAVSDPDPTDSRGDFYDWVVNNGGSFTSGFGGPSGGGRPSKQNYDDFVSTLPVTGYMSDGSLLWSPSHRDMYMWYSDRDSNKYYSYCPHFDSSDCSVSSEFTATFDCDKLITNVYSVTGGQSFRLSYISFRFTGACPVSGIYYLLAGPFVQGYSINSAGNRKSVNSSYLAGKGVAYQASSLLSYGLAVTMDNSNNPTYSFVSLQGFVPVYRVEPINSVGSTYNINTRPTSITGGNYGIVGDNGTINTVTNNNQIVNETNNTYYNPATGETIPIVNWSFDYGDRTYSLGLEGDLSVEVRYGDENISIAETRISAGDTIVNNYTIYYMTGGGDASCSHEWYQTGAVQGNCLTPAQRTYTCYLCNKQYTETDPAPGHSWRAVRTVPTTYDEDGNLTQEGYTIYECERCSEQYKSTNITGPPASGGGSSGNGSGSGSDSSGIFSGIFGIIWDFFTFFFDFFSDFVVGGIKGFIASLLDAGSDFFAILNPFSWDYGG